jgi:stage II sporulation protein D
MLALLATAFSVLTAGIQPAPPAEFRFSGRGWGHGVGLAQYGAMGYAREEGHGHRWILRHYFPGTTLQDHVTGRRVRVRLRARRTARVRGAARASAGNGRRIRLDSRATYRFVPTDGDRLEVSNAASGAVRERLRSPVRLTGPRPLHLLGDAENGRRDGDYRGTLELRGTGTKVLVVDDVGLERYLAGVVPREMPPTWPSAALRTQAVAARSYALSSLVPDRAFDVFADTRSQVYGGVGAEDPRTTAAVRATRGTIVVFQGQPARTLFHASSGGRTAASDEVFGGDPIPYLRSVDDPYDRLSPHHAWAVTLTREQIAEGLAALRLQGELVDLAVTARTPTGRASLVRVTTTDAQADLGAGRARALLGLRSTWFSITPSPASGALRSNAR